MKKNILIALAFCILTIISCDNGTTDKIYVYSESESENIYYVKYELSSGNNNMFANIANENGIINIRINSNSYSEIFGPFSKGFLTSVEFGVHDSATTINSLNTNIRIYVCRNNEPFALKAFSLNNNVYKGSSIEINYVIDF